MPLKIIGTLLSLETVTVLNTGRHCPTLLTQAITKQLKQPNQLSSICESKEAVDILGWQPASVRQGFARNADYPSASTDTASPAEFLEHLFFLYYRLQHLQFLVSPFYCRHQDWSWHFAHLLHFQCCFYQTLKLCTKNTNKCLSDKCQNIQFVDLKKKSKKLLKITICIHFLETSI